MNALKVEPLPSFVNELYRKEETGMTNKFK